MAPFVRRCRPQQNTSGIERRRRRNSSCRSPTPASASSPNTKRPPRLSYLPFARALKAVTDKDGVTSRCGAGGVVSVVSYQAAAGTSGTGLVHMR
ncbi:hypothetical protein EYF80_055964 [Liparis tanakae]|uniref:Uncharacterized protein n=1 Tax=Liparis tanakae TaxID=230148 RepID=A0A4Z2EZB0_9TELE|nr:hypothetical protein EYF80_055964 [Liparis tanakae]